MPDLLVCPDLERYHELVSGRLPAVDKEALLKHLESCEACALQLGALSPRETLVDLLRQAKTYCEGDSGEEVVRLVERLSRLNPLETPTLHDEAKTLPPQDPLVFRCSECGKNLKAMQNAASKKVKCPHCQKTVRAPAAESLTRTVAPDQSKEPDRSDGATLAPSAPLSVTDAGSIGEKRLAPSGGDTISQAGNQDPELTECLAPAQAPDELGRLGPYRVLAILGAGGMGVVYKAEDPQLKRLVALKAMLPGLGASASAKKRFLREAQSAAAIKHDHIVSIYQVGEERGVPYLAMEFLLGEPLDERLKRDKKLPLQEMLRIGREMAEGLSAAHEAGLIHRDIKPANVWLEGKKARVKILDFGLARAADEAQHLTQSGAIVGTPAYMAPEQAQGKPVDHRCDLFSLGVVLYRLCTGQMPFHGTDTVSTLMAVSTHEPPTPDKLNAQLPAALSDLVMHLLAKNPAQRVGSAEEVVRVLTDLQRQVETGAIAELKPGRSPGRMQTLASADKTNPDTVTKDAPAPTEAFPAPVPPRSRRSVLFIASTAALCFVLLGGGVLIYQLMFRTGSGTLIVEAEGDAKVAFEKGKLLIYEPGGKTPLYTLSPNDKTTNLPFGKYRIKVEGADGVELSTDEFEMTKKGWKVRVWMLPNAIAKKGPGENKPPVLTQPPIAEKGILDYAEIHDADEMRFDAWIAQMQKDGFKPISFSIQVVKDAPRYTAVALKEEKKRLWEFSRAAFGMESADIERMHAKNYSAYLQNPYTQGGKNKVAVFWQWNFPRTWMWTGTKGFIDGKTAEAARDDNLRPIYRSADDQGPQIVYSVLYGPDDGIPMKDVVDLSLSECKVLIEKHKTDGWRPNHVYAYGAGAKLLFGVTLVQEKDRPDWDISWLLTTADYEAELIARKKDGFRPHSSIGHDDGGDALRFSVIWIRCCSTDAAPVAPQAKQIAEPGVHNYAEIHDADENRFDAWIAQMKKDGFRPARMTVQTVKNAPRYTAVALKDDKNWPWEFSRVDQNVEGHANSYWTKKFEAVAVALYRDKGKTREAYLWAKDNSLDNDGLWFGDAAFIEGKIKNARKAKSRLISRTAVFEGNEPQYCIFFEAPDGVPWQESYGLVFDDLKAYVEKHKADGWRPDHFCYYGVGAKRLFGAILIKDPNKTDWDVSWSLAAADYEKELSKHKAQGFRPLSAVGHEDNAGALRFSAIWIRYRDLTAKEVRAPDPIKVKMDLKVPAAAFKHKIGMEFAVVPKGKAWLGGGDGKEGAIPVTFDRDFYLGMYEVTQEEWEKVMGFKHPFHFSRKGEGDDTLAGVTNAELKRFPVENVSWNECQLFLKKLNELDKKPGWEYRLPTEAEWEYACRGGPGDKFQSAFDFYLEEPTNVLQTAQANFEHDNALKRTRQVGSYPPNKLGLFDMHGNVAELTNDAQPEKDDDGNPRRNERGGGWTNRDDQCKATGRFAWSQVDRFRDVGLRVALVPVAKMKK